MLGSRTPVCVLAHVSMYRAKAFPLTGSLIWEYGIVYELPFLNF